MRILKKMENLLSLIKIEKLVSMVIVLGLVQFIGGIIMKKLGSRTGFIVSGFISGLVSSTAYTASLARRTRELSTDQVKVETVSYLSSTLASLTQGLFIVLVGVSDFTSGVIVFIGPVLTTLILIYISSNRNKSINPDFPVRPLVDILSLIKLTIFIVGIISISNFLQHSFGNLGIETLTFFVSLFEVHGSMIANTQLFVKNLLTVKEFQMLLTISLISSYVGKLVIVLFLGHSYFKKRILIWSTLIIASLVLSNLLIL